MLIHKYGRFEIAFDSTQDKICLIVTCDDGTKKGMIFTDDWGGFYLDEKDLENMEDVFSRFRSKGELHDNVGIS